MICPQMIVCYVCYRLHLAIVKHCKLSVRSCDADLEQLISSLQSSLCRIEEINLYDDALDFAVKFMAINLGESLLKQTARLLPQLYVSLKEKLVEISNQCCIPITQDLPCHAWLRSQLSYLLEHHLAYKCSIP